MELVERVVGGPPILAALLRVSLPGISDWGQNTVWIRALPGSARVRAHELSRNVYCRVGRPATDLVVQTTRTLDERDNSNRGHVRNAVSSCRLC